MGLNKEWEELAGAERSEKEYDKFWNEYFQKEKDIYQRLLGDKKDSVTGKISVLAEDFGMSSVEFAGFMSGINSSLIEAVDLDDLMEDSEIDVKIDFEKLYYNMLDAQAEWLYNLSEWDDILTKEKRKEIKTAYNKTKTVVKEHVPGRNDPCPCGSGKKYKKCCGK